MWPDADAGSSIGHACGIAGTLLMLWAAFGYSWRKRPGRRAGGNARSWMRSHVAAGVAGPALVLWHGGLAFEGLAGVTTALVLMVVASGAVGRWLYTALPRDGALADEAMRRIDAELASLRGHAEAEGSAEDDGAVAVATRVATLATRQAREGALLALRAQHARHATRRRVGARARRVLAAWWVLHVPLSMAMLLLALVHALAVLYYRTW
jgi:hypothetical protein